MRRLAVVVAIVASASSCTPAAENCETWRMVAQRATEDLEWCRAAPACRMTMDDVEYERWANRRADEECRYDR